MLKNSGKDFAAYCRVVIIATALLLVLVMGLAGCGAKKDAGTPAQGASAPEQGADSAEQQAGAPEQGADSAEKEANTEEVTLVTGAAALTEEEVLEAVKNYCYMKNPDLRDMEGSEDYTIYWDVSANEDGGIVVLFHSYTGAETRYYIDPSSGDTYAAEFVPGITEGEEKTDESFNVRDYLDSEA